MPCPMCGGPLTGRLETCSDRCRQRLARARRQAERESLLAEVARLRALVASRE